MLEIDSQEALMIWLMNRLSEAYSENAILKGGMVLRLLDCPRYTNDLDYVFIPFKSKKEILPLIEKVVEELEGAQIKSQLHSTSLRIIIEYKNIKTQIEANVSDDCKAEPMSTASLAKENGQLGRIIRVMSLDWALSNKIAAWNERGLMRDVYDIYYLHSVLGVKPDLNILKDRLAIVRLQTRNRSCSTKKMSFEDLSEKISAFSERLTQKQIDDGLLGILPPKDLVGLEKIIKDSLSSLQRIMLIKTP